MSKSRNRGRRSGRVHLCMRPNGLSKIGWRSRAKAERKARAARAAAGGQLYVYRCPDCDWWHLTSSKPFPEPDATMPELSDEQYLDLCHGQSHSGRVWDLGYGVTITAHELRESA